MREERDCPKAEDFVLRESVLEIHASQLQKYRENLAFPGSKSTGELPLYQSDA